MDTTDTTSTPSPRRIVLLASPPTAPEATPDGTLPLRKLVRRALRHHLARLRESLPVARAGRDPEGLHDLRTAVRRLRTTLETVEDAPTFDRKRLHQLRQRLGRLARTLGRVRDLDVLRDHLERFASAHPSFAADLKPLYAELNARHAHARRALLDELDRPRTSRLLRQLDRLAAHPPMSVHHGAAAAHPPLVRHFAGGAIWRRYEAVLAFETDLPGASPETLHALRIACKRLRYTLELFADGLGPDAAPLLEAVTAAQDDLGTLHDHTFALALLVPLQKAHPGNAGLAAYAAARTAEREQLQDAFAPLWERLSGLPFRQALAALIAAL